MLVFLDYNSNLRLGNFNLEWIQLLLYHYISLAKLLFSSLNFEKFVFSSLKVRFYTNFVIKKKKKSLEMKFMCKNKFFQSSGTKNELFKVQERKPNFMQNLETKTIV